MIEVILREYLTESLSYPVFLEKPENPPEEYIVLERTGDGEEDFIRDATIALQTYAGSLYRAASMAEEIAAVMGDAVTLNEVTSVELNSIYNYTNRLTKEYRYQAVFDVIYYT